MGYLVAGFRSYRSYLASDLFHKIKEEAWARSSKKCEVCGKRYDLHAHHLSYDRLTTSLEVFDLRFLCARHHKMCHSVLWVFRVPLTSVALRVRYYVVKSRYVVLSQIYYALEWVWHTYTVYGDSPRSKRRLIRRY